MEPLKELAELEYKARYEGKTIPEYARYRKRFSDTTANKLTQAIITFLNLNGWQAERINTTGRPLDQRKTVTDCIGRTSQIGSTKWIPGTGQRGSADIAATIRGMSVKIEVKMKDSQSEAQRSYQKQVERAGGLYWLVRSFDEFIENYNTLMQ